MRRFIIADYPDQQFGLVLNNRRVTMRLRYNPTSEHWSFDLSIDDVPVLHGRKIVVGINLLEPFDFGLGAIFAIRFNDSEESNRTALPAGNIRMYYATTEEFEALKNGIIPS